ncbi:sensor histidine kinase [Amycolatopsis benzoatilytica]|uniref:sensor histidine kinase n=1 Tax=Amycolatopsis benzoatilytica TaxID=346045 RepID=UPI000365CBFC|nr:histidine kinase [Amycolatopsis benzoatilytica]
MVKSWLSGIGVGFVRAAQAAGVAMLVPAVWAAAYAVWQWWGGNPWSWIAPFVWAVIGTLLLARPVCQLSRALVANWTGIALPPGYRELPPITQLSTGYWWNGHSYSRTSEEARREQRLKSWRYDPATCRDLRFTLLAPISFGLVALIPVLGVLAAVLTLFSSLPKISALGPLLVAIATAPFAWRTIIPVANRLLGASAAMTLAERVDVLTAQRADTTIAQAAEIRRIERDLHDGAQARLVAVGLALATAEKLMETDPVQAKELLRDARAGAATSLTELRELVRGISPPVLTERGLADAVRAMALDSPLEVIVDAGPLPKLDPPVESALYFSIAELLTNAIKHAHASQVQITVTREGNQLRAEVRDNGRGGAGIHSGGGLAGLRRRLAVFDGTFEISSPEGGPTRAWMMVPCESS